MPKKISSQPSSKYFITLKLNGKVLKTKGETILEALNNLNPDHYKTRGLLTAKHGKNMANVILPIHQMRRLFHGMGMTKIIFAKRIKILLGE